MTPTIALIAVSLIAAGLCVAVGIMQWRINQLNAENDRGRARHDVTNELLTEALNEAKVENDLRRQAERNLAEANEAVTDWRNDAVKYEHIAKKLESTCDDLFDTLCDAVEKMPVPFHLRKRDDNGRFVKVSAFEVATALHGEMAEANRQRLRDMAMKAALPDRAHAAFNSVMGNPIEQLQGLTVRKLCEEVKGNAASGI